MVSACVALCHGVLPAMQSAGGGWILHVASLAGLVPGLPGSPLYSASKAFLIRFSQSLALENRGNGVRVMALCPGSVPTGFHAALGVEERMCRNLPGLCNRLIATLTHWRPEGPAGRLTTAFSRRYRRR